VWTAGLLCWIIDSLHKPGIMREITDELVRRGASTKNDPKTFDPLEEGLTTYNKQRDYAYDPEVMKVLLEEMAQQAGARVRLHTRVVAAYADAQRRVTHVVTESASGREAWQASAFVDASGDGDLAARLGCGFDMGRTENGELQPMSMFVLLTGLDPDQADPYITEWRSGVQRTKARLLEEIRRGGVEPSYTKPVLMRIRDDLYVLGANHEYLVKGTNADNLTLATLRARREVHAIVDGLRALGGVWRTVRIVATPEQIGIREGRRVHGHYTVTADDLLEGRHHDDAVCRVTFPVDVHSTNPAQDKGYTNAGVRAKPYDIPYRALIARDVDGLLLAGRCISGDFVAHASYRVTGNAVVMGQAAGIGAALAARYKCLPQQVPWAEIAELMGD
jgi:hypothetical protein